MKTNFAWVSESEVFSPNAHNLCDLDILELRIDHHEGEVALATIIVPQIELPPWDQRHVFISIGETLIFSGRLVGLPVKIKDDLFSLELTAEPLNALQQLQELGHELKKAPYWDECFVDPSELNNPTEWLEARHALFAWDRVQQNVSLSDLFEGRQTQDVSEVFFIDSLKVLLAETPIAQISVTLTAEWTQKIEGEVNIAQRIASCFPGGIINTLTPKALRNSWYQDGQKLGRTGYWIIKSSLKAIQPPQTGILNIYPTLTPEFLSFDEGDQQAKPIKARHFWMSASLILGWRFRQRRQETVCFTLTQKTQLDGKIRPRTRQIKINLQKIENMYGSTFFLTNRGRQAIEHALERARVHLAASVRCLEIEVNMPFEAGIFLTLDHCLQITDSRIPGGGVIGKVIAYQLYQDGSKSFAWVRIAASIGGQSKEPSPFEYRVYVDPQYGDTSHSSAYMTMSGLQYSNYDHQRPTEGIVDCENMTLHDILPEVLVSNDGMQQTRTLFKHQYPLRHNMKNLLEEMPTVVSLKLLDLKTTAVAKHTIELMILNSWTAPAQVNLMGL